MSFKSWKSYWDFSQEVTRGNRYVHSDDVKDFLSNVLETSNDRVKIINPDSEFWRAQLGSDRRPVVHDGEKVRDALYRFQTRE